MAKAYNHHQLSYQTYYSSNSFIPLLCRPSVTDVKIQDLKDQSSSVDPSSPKVSCIGQIKRNNKMLIPFSTTGSTLPSSSTQAGTKTNGNQITYTKLKKWFSVKNSSPATTNVSMVYSRAGGGSCRSGRRETSRWSSNINNGDDGGNHVRVNVGELDPPLPVIKKLSVLPSEMSLWRRRSVGGEALKSLQVHHQIHLPNEPAATL